MHCSTFVAVTLGLSVSQLAFSQSNGPQFFDPPTVKKQTHGFRTETAPVLDGRLDDTVWQQAPKIDDFIEYEPNQGRASAHPMVVQIAYDDSALYVAARLTQPGGQKGLNQRDMRRDFNFPDTDSFGLILDPLGDGRNCVSFQVSPFGTLRDMQVIDDDIYEQNWDTVWSAKTTRDDTGWTVEMAIPWKSLRHNGGTKPFGLQFFRRERGINIDTVWSPVPRSISAWRMSYAGELVGVKPPAPGLLNLQLRPYGIVRAERIGEGQVGVAPSVGGEITWNPTPSTVVDLTANTDFAETDVDRRVVNLSRFSVLFPERRQFFLESSGVFQVGFDEIQPFFSRTIGLNNGERVPMSAGLRTVYRTPTTNAGALVVHTLPTPKNPSTLFAIGRYSRNLTDTTKLGGLIAFRHDFAHKTESGQWLPSTNVVPTVDGLYRKGPLSLGATAMSSFLLEDTKNTAGVAGTGYLNINQNWGFFNIYTFGSSPTFEAKTGFVSRPSIFAVGSNFNADYRPPWKPSFIRTMGPALSVQSIWDTTAGAFQEANVFLNPWQVEFAGGDEAGITTSHSVQTISEAFSPVPKVKFEPRTYDYQRVGFFANTQNSRKVAGGIFASYGGYYSASQLELNPYVSIQPIPHTQLIARWSVNRFTGEGVQGDSATTHLLSFDTRIALNPRFSVFASYQRDTAGNASILNARLSWEFLPLSFVYVVFTDTRSAFPAPGLPPTEQRLTVKATYTWRP
jgi:Domain of unknown function (DUF5916)/Carbohydrate family 9 binding domain-like